MIEQFDMFGDTNLDSSKNNHHIIKNGEYIYIPDFFSKPEGNDLLIKLREKTLWKQESMNLYGKQLPFPRLTAWYGDNDKPYRFSGITLQPNPWTDDLLYIKNKVEAQSGKVFNSVLLNQYRDGSDSISWHTDAEPELGKNPVIASVTFGETRKFQLRHIQTKERIDIELIHGSLLIMKGELQHFWQHQIPKTTTVKNGRINLTFRTIHPK